jgi:hypothetical protein
LAFADGKGLVLVGVRLKRRLEKQVARHGPHGRQYALIADAALRAQQCDEGPALAPVAVGIG